MKDKGTEKFRILHDEDLVVNIRNAFGLLLG
jgi:hypothetical protein